LADEEQEAAECAQDGCVELPQTKADLGHLESRLRAVMTEFEQIDELARAGKHEEAAALSKRLTRERAEKRVEPPSLVAYWGKETADAVPRTGPLPMAMRERIERHVARHAGALELLHEGAKIGFCRYETDWSRGLDGLMGLMAGTKNGTAVLCFEALLRAEQGDLDGCVRAVVDALAVSRALRCQPMLMSHLVVMDGLHGACAVTERLLNIAELSAEHLGQLGAGLTEADDADALGRVFVGERCFGIDSSGPSLAEHLDLFGLPRRALPLLWFYRMSGWSGAENLCWLGFMRRRIEAAALPFRARLDASEALDAETVSQPWYRPAMALTLPALWGFARTDAVWLALVRATVGALAVEAFRRAHGRLPDALADVVPDFAADVPADPFLDEPLRYCKTDAGYTVYSVGPNGTDEGGSTEPCGQHRVFPEDIAVVVER